MSNSVAFRDYVLRPVHVPAHRYPTKGHRAPRRSQLSWVRIATRLFCYAVRRW